MTSKRMVRVRMLQAVTYGTGPAWPRDSVHSVPVPLAAVMVEKGEAEYVLAKGLDTTVAGPRVERTR
jgi:hypothetical protein